MHFECIACEPWSNESFGGAVCADDPRSRSPERFALADAAVVESVMGSTTLSSPFRIGDYYFTPKSGNFRAVSHKGLLESFFSYTELVAQYTMRSLAQDSDGLNAFLGIANTLRQFDHPVSL